MWASYPASSCPFSPIHWSEISFLEGRKNLTAQELWCTHSNTHKYIKHRSEARLEFRHMVLWFVIAVWAVKAASTSSDLNVHLTNTSCVYLTSMTHVQSVWRHMRREVWYTHTCGNVRKPVEKKTVKWGMIGMFTRTSHTCPPDVRCTWSTLCCVVLCWVILYLGWAWSSYCHCCVCLVNIYTHLLSGKGHSFHMGHPLTTCKQRTNNKLLGFMRTVQNWLIIKHIIIRRYKHDKSNVITAMCYILL